MRSRLAPVLQVASLLLTGWVLWGARLAPHWSRVSVFDLVMRSTVYALAACAAGAAITLVLYVGARGEREDLFRATMRTSGAAVWFAPAVILFAALSPAAIAAAAVLVVSATRLLYYEWRVAHPPLPVPKLPDVLFASVQFPPPAYWSAAAPGLLLAFTAQLGAAALLLQMPLLAGVALAMALSLATVFRMSGRSAWQRRPESLPRSALGVLLTLVLAIGLTVGGLLPQVLGGHGSGEGFGFGLGSGSGEAEVKAPAPKPRGEGTTDSPDFPKFSDPFAEGGFPGVILWPEVKPYATLIAPMPQRGDGLATVEARPMSIPFSGEYWMFRWPFARPPRTSYFQRGSPANLSFRTTDHTGLQMEARHKIDQPIALDCCSRIDLAIRNADRFPGTIAIELVLIDNETPGAPSLSLGRDLVASQPDLGQNPAPPVAEMLRYTVPASAAPISKFDEFRVVFLRDRRRMDQSAKVAVDRFVLVPRL